MLILSRLFKGVVTVSRGCYSINFFKYCFEELLLKGVLYLLESILFQFFVCIKSLLVHEGVVLNQWVVTSYQDRILLTKQSNV